MKPAILTAQQAKACCECVHFVADTEHAGHCTRPGEAIRGHGTTGRFFSCRHWQPLKPPEPIRWGAFALYPDGKWHRIPT